MPKYRRIPLVMEAVQITEKVFNGSHPNPEQVAGVIYIPQSKMVQILTPQGNVFGKLGDWIVISPIDGEKFILGPETFPKLYEGPVEG